MKARKQWSDLSSEQWSDLSSEQRIGIKLAGVLQFALAAAAWFDLAMRPARKVRGKKSLWAIVIGLNFVGPIAYFLRGRQ
ncbi:PLD nuclease N-terminal domain-containing protein [Cryobacterium psychrophilum]|uniref:PLDc_N domain-containing protein n=1 Tax=Cryobacterium psychrophilum TaxID=41988 RepID=A0A4Y8KT54_9MICO|nr:PLD nuclease N-terminal domain-containing protein [Cryobacterium psychrophilum]TDW28694.1 phospholipase D-like protein [Cryobacterium psychrophilum]TFD82352.1 PLDc_N domain-containing protein [Cryobacterium psychrophilum]